MLQVPLNTNQLTNRPTLTVCGQRYDAVPVRRALERHQTGRHVRRQDERNHGRLGLPVSFQDTHSQRQGS